MNRSGLKAGALSLARGSTFKTRGGQLSRAQANGVGVPRRAISPASPEQRARVAEGVSITGAEGPCDPAHLWPRGRGGCDSALCVVALTRDEHREFDDGHLDILGHLLAHGLVAEIQHALGHADGNLPALLLRLTGQRWAPVAAEVVYLRPGAHA